MAQHPQSDPNGDNDIAYPRLPSFLKFFSMIRNADNLRLPPSFVADHGNTIPVKCILVMPNGNSSRVDLLNIASGCHFRTGWPEFVHQNDIRHGDSLVFTLVGPGIFDVKRYSLGSGYPPRRDLQIMEDGMESDEPLSLDIETSDDYMPSSESETDTDEDEDYTSDHRALEGDEKPSFRVVIAECHIERTLEIPIGFWRRHIPKSPVEAEVYFTTDDGTWLVELDQKASKIWVRKGWTRFRAKNNLVKGVRCTFQLVDVNEVHFYAHFDR